jgi:hypothetical protein
VIAKELLMGRQADEETPEAKALREKAERASSESQQEQAPAAV